MSSWSIGPVGGPRARSGLPGSRRVVSTWRVGRIVPLGPDRLRVVSSSRPASFVLAGAGLLVAGLTTWAVRSGAPWPPVALGAVLATALLGAGLLPAWDRITLEIGPEGLQLTRSVRFRKERTVLPRTAVRSVRIHRAVNPGRGGPFRYPVALEFAPEARVPGVPRELVLRQHRSELPARRDAETLARALGAPLEEHLGNRPIVRAPDALDARPVREPDPGEPPPGAPVRLLPDAPAVELVTGTAAGRRFAAALALGSVAATGLAAGVWLWIGLEGGVPWPIFAAIGGVEVAFLAAVLPMAWSRRLVVAVEGGRVELREGGPRLFRRPRSIPVDAIETLRLERAGPLGWELALVGDDRILRISGLSRGTATWLRQWMAARVGRPPGP